MLEWYKDNELQINFNKAPNVKVRYIPPYVTKQEKKEIKKKPFVCSEDLEVRIVEYDNPNRTYEFVIPQQYCWDGASIPKLFWRIVGSNADNTFLIASLVHDVLCENKLLVDCDRNLSSRIFKALLITGGVSKFKAQTMYLAVDNFQKFQKGWE